MVSDHDLLARHVPGRVSCRVTVTPADGVQRDRHATDWVLLTSGTTGAPKLLVHTLAGLTAPIKSSQHQGTDVVWGTFYDIRRYRGLQIFLRALLGRGSVVPSSGRQAP